ncbi:MAG TPA: efflux RND transporter periplasmic adaptor subunit [Candidatus Binataceae bacterium]|nr:efflux RND transporter periplasmic adaptor subunit [Candidatus Binataceae bacterium]
MEDDPRQFTAKPSGRFFVAGWIGAVAIVLVATAGLVLARELWIGRQTGELTEQAARGPHVLVATVGRTPATRVVTLPATTRGFDETEIYAKVPGYIKSIRVDKGDRVKAGELLAVIESPETDQQVRNAAAAYQIAKLTDDRNQTLVRQNVISQQIADESHATMMQAKATLAQFVATQAYERVTAPFDAIVTARDVDPGHLIPQATSSTSLSDAIVRVARMKPLRVYTYVPQNVALFIRNGDHATITVNEYPQRKFLGTITRHPEALAPDSRTMLVEVDLPNTDLALYPGMYGNSEFVVSVPAGAPLVPDDALIFRDGKVFVPVVKDNRLHLAQVSLGYDNGIAVVVRSGIAPDAVVALNVGQAARDGERVQPVTQPLSTAQQ